MEVKEHHLTFCARCERLEHSFNEICPSCGSFLVSEAEDYGTECCYCWKPELNKSYEDYEEYLE